MPKENEEIFYCLLPRLSREQLSSMWKSKTKITSAVCTNKVQTHTVLTHGSWFKRYRTENNHTQRPHRNRDVS